MRRGDLVIAGVVAVVTGLSWAVSVDHDDERVRATSFAAGQEWAQRTAARPSNCQFTALGRTGPRLDTTAWRAGCIARAEATTPPPQPPAPPEPPRGTPTRGLPEPR